jgi:hypothetical protein
MARVVIELDELEDRVLRHRAAKEQRTAENCAMRRSLVTWARFRPRDQIPTSPSVG